MLSLTNGHFNYLGFALLRTINDNLLFIFVVCLNANIWGMEL
jgi:hypothetical protein